MKTISRSGVKMLKIDIYDLILDSEKHHTHKIIEDSMGTLRWEEIPVVSDLVDAMGGLNVVIPKLEESGHDKNSELYREMYRSIGYSLSGYWEIFYWEVNNEQANEYKG